MSTEKYTISHHGQVLAEGLTQEEYAKRKAEEQEAERPEM